MDYNDLARLPPGFHYHLMNATGEYAQALRDVKIAREKLENAMKLVGIKRDKAKETYEECLNWIKKYDKTSVNKE